MLEMIDITKTYRAGAVETPVLRGVTFKVERGEFVAIMGSSGTGKTTLMNILGCLDVPTGGKYLLDGVDVFQNNDDAISSIRNEKIGFVFQQFHLLDRASALDNVLLPLTYADKYPADASAKCVSSLKAVGLGDRMDYRPNQLSGGQQQRVSIARALMNGGDVILADEPTGALDSTSSREMMDVLHSLHDQGHTIVLVTHEEDIAKHAKRQVRFLDGCIVSDKFTMEATA